MNVETDETGPLPSGLLEGPIGSTDYQNTISDPMDADDSRGYWASRLDTFDLSYLEDEEAYRSSEEYGQFGQQSRELRSHLSTFEEDASGAWADSVPSVRQNVETLESNYRRYRDEYLADEASALSKN